MASSAQIAANIANAQHSTGPRTEAGKAASSQNAMKHGFNSQTVLLPGEDEAAYRKLCADFLECFSPMNALEEQLLQTLCDTQWRIHRCARLEAAALSGEVPDFKALDIISKHHARLQKIFSETLKQFTEMATQHRAARKASLELAMLIRRADVLRGRPTDLRANGFEFSLEEVDAMIAREDKLLQAQRARQFAA